MESPHLSKNMLITGGAGCIGSELATALLDRGHQVTVLDNLSSGRREHLASVLGHSRFRFREGDVLDAEALDAAMSGSDMVWHLAANPDVKFAIGDATDKDLRQNTLATYHVLEAMRRHKIDKLAFSSTSAVYGPCKRLPIGEHETPQPISLYGASKLACEALIGAFQHLFEMQVWIFRFANIVGPKVRTRGRTVIGDFIQKLQDDPTQLEILGNGKQAKSYLLNNECVDAMLYVVEQAREPFNRFNLGCDDWLSVDRIADLIVEAMGLHDVTFKYTGTEGGWPGDVPRFVLDVRALNTLGWKAKYNSEQAVRVAIRAAMERVCGTDEVLT
ncbi:MAG: SDR family NAD(P)-dependent oxidoreductase [Planctomycetia bacterium]|nr:SDR family NAD(P)-dependent oxidoreductase [Planctomycetia bacterium]